MTAQIIDYAAKRRERGLPEQFTLARRFEALIDASLMLNPLALLWLESYGHASLYNTEPAVIYLFEDETA